VKTVFFDVDTQIDFLYPAGALYVPGAETIVERVAALNRHAASHGIPVISDMDAHTEDDPEFKLWPHHCVAGTAGQQKPARTLLEKRLVVPNAPCELALDGVEQILLEKQTLDCASNVNFPALLERLGAGRYVVYGVVTEICVKLAAFGLLKTGGRVELVTDAVRSLKEDEAAKTLAEFTAAGGVLTTVTQVVRITENSCYGS
jgi:nicotinamidase/pyrazinamidase